MRDRREAEAAARDLAAMLRVWDDEAAGRSLAPARLSGTLAPMLAMAERNRVGWAACRGVALAVPAMAPLLAPAQAAREAHARLVFAQLAEAGAALARAGVRATALKGAAFLAAGGAPAPWREMVDLDLLVAPRDLAAAVRALRAAGWRADEAAFVSGGDYHFPAMFPESGLGATIELHVRLGWDAGALLDPAAVAARASASALEGLATPAPEDRLAHLVRHAMIADRGLARGALPLRGALDWRRLNGAAHAQALATRFEAAGQGASLRAWQAAMALIWDEPAPPDRAARAWARRALDSLADPEAAARRAARDAMGAPLRALASPERRAHLLRALTNPARVARFVRGLRRRPED
ncbi:nucleotidyltransferase family protein [Oceanicella actignis]|uniref:Uncharacterized nucleotidyltransferase n=1 Tax=Oceanicella actignis TaxID=1189325 RepID=A0A1M7T5R1_9RHOB|nr:nucleotidyltransferase family protein [Oceanicella actignis]SET43693.1 Uncharacterised nucleotidyltransferase [Oceanicella actignis]SHN66054.1 Uncharacterised nucleotidyltransferase [Oceanicella actignis]